MNDQPTMNAPRHAAPYPRQKSPRWKWGIPLTVIGTLTFMIILASLMMQKNDTNGTPTTDPAASVLTPLEAAQQACSAGQIADGGHTLIVDMLGNEPGTGTASIDDVNCVLDALSTPDSVRSRIAATRALDGMQDGEWDGLHATWTYHPDNGLDITITDGE